MHVRSDALLHDIKKTLDSSANKYALHGRIRIPNPFRTPAAPIDRVYVTRIAAWLRHLLPRLPPPSRAPLLFSAKAGKSSSGGRSPEGTKATEKQCWITGPTRLPSWARVSCSPPRPTARRMGGGARPCRGPWGKRNPKRHACEQGPALLTLAYTASVLLPPVGDRHALTGARARDPVDPTDRETGSGWPLWRNRNSPAVAAESPPFFRFIRI